MSTSTQIPESVGPTPARPDDLIWRLSVAKYHEMIQAGILTSDDPVELLEGWLVLKMPKNPRHRIATRTTRQLLEAITPSDWYVDTQEPITLADSEPEPDVVVVRGETRMYADSHPGPTDVALAVEVSDATLDRDRGTKRRLYARAGIPVYWILNLADRLLEVYTDPTGPLDKPEYRQCHIYGPDDIVPVVISGQTVGHLTVAHMLD